MSKMRFKGGWENVQEDCMLCEMDERTEWYLETKDFVIAEKLGGGPFIVSKTHEEELSEERREKAERLVSILYDSFDLRVLMNMVEDHWHAHILTNETQADLSDE